jgi:hypothetical protein
LRDSRIHLLLLCIFCVGCAASRPSSRFESLIPLSSQPEIFDSIQNVPSQMEAKIGIRVPGLRGTARGILRHAKADQYLIELFGREDLFLKVYITSTQTIVWPAIGAPKFYTAEETPTLSESVHSSLPAWRLDDVLPIPRRSSQEQQYSEWRTDSKARPTERLSRAGSESIYKFYSSASNDPAFPFGKVVLRGENGGTRLTWTLKPKLPAN